MTDLKYGNIGIICDLDPRMGGKKPGFFVYLSLLNAKSRRNPVSNVTVGRETGFLRIFVVTKRQIS